MALWCADHRSPTAPSSAHGAAPRGGAAAIPVGITLRRPGGDGSSTRHQRRVGLVGAASESVLEKLAERVVGARRPLDAGGGVAGTLLDVPLGLRAERLAAHSTPRLWRKARTSRQPAVSAVQVVAGAERGVASRRLRARLERPGRRNPTRTTGAAGAHDPDPPSVGPWSLPCPRDRDSNRNHHQLVCDPTGITFGVGRS